MRVHFRPTQDFEVGVLGDLSILREEHGDTAKPLIKTVSAGEKDGDGSIRSGRIVQIKGRKLAFDPKDATQGLFFVDAEGKELRSPYYPLIQPSSVLGSVPAELPAGYYALVLRSAALWVDLREDRFEGVAITA